MFLTDWFYRVLASRGLWQKEAKILLLGPQRNLLGLQSDEGKTVLLSWLGDEMGYLPGQFPAFPISGELIIGNIKFKLFDLGDLQTTRRTMRDYYFKVDAVVYVYVPPSPPCPGSLKIPWGCRSMPAPLALYFYARDVEEELKKQLNELRSDEAFANVPLLTLEVRPFVNSVLDSFGVTNVSLGNSNVGPVKKFTCYRSSGWRDGFKWLSQHIK